MVPLKRQKERDRPLLINLTIHPNRTGVMRKEYISNDSGNKNITIDKSLYLTEKRINF